MGTGNWLHLHRRLRWKDVGPGMAHFKIVALRQPLFLPAGMLLVLFLRFARFADRSESEPCRRPSKFLPI